MTSLSDNHKAELATIDEAAVDDQLPAQVQIEQSKAIQEVQAALVIAKRFPRDEVAAFARIMKACNRLGLAEQAIYALPISGKNHEGPSIRLAEVMAQAWGNIKFGIKEISRTQGRSHCAAYCWDQETNGMSESEFTVDHWIEVGKNGAPKTKKILTDPVEIDRLIANRGARKLRNCILSVMPSDVIDDAMRACRATLAKGGGEPLSDRIRKAVVAFESVAVSKQMLEEYLKHPIEETMGEEIVGLMGIYKSIVDKQAKRADFFKTGEVEKQTSPLAEKLKGAQSADPIATEPSMD